LHTYFFIESLIKNFTAGCDLAAFSVITFQPGLPQFLPRDEAGIKAKFNGQSLSKMVLYGTDGRQNGSTKRLRLIKGRTPFWRSSIFQSGHRDFSNKQNLRRRKVS
jgi:hypothetical protein